MLVAKLASIWCFVVVTSVCARSTQHRHHRHRHRHRHHGRGSKIQRNLKFKHQPIDRHEDWYADNLFPRHVFSHLREQDNATVVHGRRAADDECQDALCHGYSCQSLLNSIYTCEELNTTYGCTSCAICEECLAANYGDDDGGCKWPAGKPTSCGAADESDCYTSNIEAAEAGETHPFRVKYVRQYLEASAGDSSRSSATCYAVGQVVDPCYFDYGRESYRCPVACTEDDIITPEKLEFANERLDWAEEYLGQLFSTVDLFKPLEIESSTLDGEMSNLEESSYPDYDIVIIVTMHPSGVGAGIAGYALPLQHYAGTDQVDDPATRVVVAQFNWCPDQINEDNVDSKSELSKAARLIIHETLHTMNAVKTDSRYHANSWGGQRCQREIYVDSEEEWSGIYTRKVVTNRTLTVAREQFGCSTLEGVPIENQYIGYGSHWESRIAGPEVLAYGENTGESYISDITLAFIEDLGFFVANYSHAGRFGDPAQEPFVDTTSILTKLQSGPGSDFVHTFDDEVSSPGHLRWGRNEGCEFVFGSPAEWPEQYLCSDSSSDGCTPDNRLTARCSLTSWGGAGETLELFYKPSSSGSSWEVITWSQYVPDVFDYLGEGVNSEYLGASDAMDFVPIRIGYWNCLDQRPPSDIAGLFSVTSEITHVDENTTSTEVEEREEEEEEEKVDLNDILDEVTNSIGEVGGQSFCEHCRCFSSGLVPVSDIVHFDPEFARKGLCYQFNCYSNEYLQVGIKSGEELNWYACPPEGGELYVAGYFGSLLCPNAQEFCATETTTGILMTEIDPVLEWVLWGLLGGACGILFFVYLGCYRRIDHKIRFCCGINQDGKHFAKMLARSQGRHSPAGWILTIFSGLWFIVGLGVIGFAVYTLLPDTELLWDTQSRQVPLMFAFGIIVAVLAAIGIHGAWKRVPSIALIVYFYVVLVLALGSAFAAMIPFVLGDLVQPILEVAWPSVKPNFPDSWQDYNSTTALHEAELLLTEHLTLVIAAASFVILSMVVGVICSYLNLTAHVITRNFEMIMNVVFFSLGIFAIWSGMQTLSSLSTEVMIFFLCGCGMLVLTGFIGVMAACQKRETFFKAYAVFGSLNCIVAAACGAGLLYLGGVMSTTGIAVVSTFCAETFPTSTSCTCGSTGECSTLTCSTLNLTCSEMAIAFGGDHDVTVPRVGVCNLHAMPAVGNGTTAPFVTTHSSRRQLAGTTVANATPSTFTTTEGATTSIDVATTFEDEVLFSAWYTCNSTTSFTINPRPIIDGSVAQFLQTLNITEQASLSQVFAQTESDTLTDLLEDYDEGSLLALAELNCIIFGLMLWLGFVFQCLLLITNQAIIKWNYANNHPHGKDPYWRTVHRALNKRKAVSKVNAIMAFKKAGRKTLGFANIKVSPEELDRVHRWSVKLKLQPEAFGDGVWGLGMSFSERQLEDDGAVGRKIVEVSGFRVGEDDDGIEVMSPGLAAGLQVGDRIIQINGFEVIGGVKEFSLEVDEAKYMEDVVLLVERITQKGTRTPSHKRKRAPRWLPDVDAHSKLSGMDGWEPEVSTVVLGGDVNEPVGINISEIYGSGNEGYGVEKAYLTVNFVRPGSRGDRFGIKPHDTIVAVNNHLVFSTIDFSEAVHGKESPSVLLHRVVKSDVRPSTQRQFHCEVDLDPGRMGGIGLGARLIEVGAMMWRKDVPAHRKASTCIMVNKLVSYHNGTGRAGPAEVAGIREYDLIIKVDGEEVYTMLQLVNKLKNAEKAKITVRRAPPPPKVVTSAWQ